MGLLCGMEVERLGFQHGVSEVACARLGGRLDRGACVVTTRFIDVVSPAHPGQPGLFCQGKRDPRVIITTTFFDMSSTGTPDPDEPSVASVVLHYLWEVGGTEACRLGNPDHVVDSGVAGVSAAEAGTRDAQLERLHDAVWARLFGEASAPVRWTCLLHPEDPS